MFKHPGAKKSAKKQKTFQSFSAYTNFFHPAVWNCAKNLKLCHSSLKTIWKKLNLTGKFKKSGAQLKFLGVSCLLLFPRGFLRQTAATYVFVKAGYADIKILEKQLRSICRQPESESVSLSSKKWFWNLAWKRSNMTRNNIRDYLRFSWYFSLSFVLFPSTRDSLDKHQLSMHLWHKLWHQKIQNSAQNSWKFLRKTEINKQPS